MIRRIICQDVVQYDGPLGETLLPTTLDDIALQMGSIADDNTDIALCHIESDRLLLTALRIVAASYTNTETSGVISDIINNFNKVDKIYE